MSTPPTPPLTLPPEQMRALGYRVVDRIVEHLQTLPQQRVTYDLDAAALRAAVARPPPEEPGDVETALATLEAHVLSNIMHVDHPRFFAYIPGPGNFVSAVADMLAAGLNIFQGTWLASAGPTQVELTVIDWMRGWCGLPAEAGGLLVSGGSMANVTALATARQVMGEGLRDPGIEGWRDPGIEGLRDPGIEGLREHGCDGEPVVGGPASGRSSARPASGLSSSTPAVSSPVVYFSDQTHASVERALRVLGFAAQQCRKLPTDAAWRLDVAALQTAVEADRAAGRRPMCVVANAATTNTGAVDPLAELADFCAAEHLWLHVDGAYGAAAVLCDEGRAALRGIERADSIALDPHKWLFQPFECGCVLVRNRRWLARTFRVTPHYMQDAHKLEPETNFADWGVQLTRSARALKLWLSIQVFGLRAFRAAIERGLALARVAEAALRAAGCWEIVTPASMGIVSFRYAPPGLDAARADAVNSRLVAAVFADGYAMISSTQLAGRTVLRLCPINPRTSEQDVRSTVARMGELARAMGETAEGGLR